MLTILAGPTSERTSFPCTMPGRLQSAAYSRVPRTLLTKSWCAGRLADDPEVSLALQRPRIGVRVEFGRGVRRFGGVRGGPGFDGGHWAPPVPAGRSAAWR